MKLRTLGGLRLEDVEFSGSKSLTLLAYLALEGPKERSFVADLFWLGSADPLNRLSTTLSRLRNVGPDLFAADDARVWARIETDAGRLLDVAERGDHEAVVELYAGPFLGRVSVDGSVELEEWIHAKREFLAGIVRRSLIAVALDDAAAGRYYVAAKRAERAYRLEGAAPPPRDELATLHALLLAGDNAYARELRSEAAAYDVTLASSSGEARERLRATMEPVRAATSRRPCPELSTGRGVFLGRDQERRHVLELLGEPACRLLTIVAPGGMGKTRLALDVAEHAGPAFPDGACVVPFATVEEPDQMVDAIAEALGIPLSDRDPEAQLLRALQARAMLLVLDNLEHLLDGADLVARIVEAAHGTKVLATSREQLHLRSEWRFALGGLAYPRADAGMSLERRRQEFGAPELFEQSARRVQRDFRLDEDSIATVVRICEAVGGMPLALELAAGWLDTLALEDVAREVEREIDILETDASDVPARHRSMRAVFASSWDRLSPGEREIVAQLSVFAGSFTREAAASVAGTDLRSLRTLVSKSFVSLEGDRYVMHELLRQFARKALEADPAHRNVAEHRHAACFLGMLERELPNFKGPEQRALLGRIALDLPNIHRAWRGALERGDWGLVSRAATALSVFCHHTNRDREGAEAFGFAMRHLDRAGDAITDEARIAILVAFASFQISTHAALDEAEAAARRAIDLYEQSGQVLDIDPMCHPYFAGYKSAQSRGDYRAALRYSERLYDVLLPSYPVRAEFSAHAFTALSYLALGELDRAKRYLDASYAVAVAAREDLHAENLTALLGGLATQMGDLDRAQEYLEACLRMAEKHGVPRKRAEALYGMTLVALERGDLEEAERAARLATRVSAQLGMTQYVAVLNAYSAEIALRRGDLDAAVPHLRDALSLIWTGRPNRYLAIVLLRIADFLHAAGEREREQRILRWVAGHSVNRASERAAARDRLGIGGAEEVHAGDLGIVMRDLQDVLERVAGR